MPRGRKPLDPDLRLQRRHESLKRYAEKNAEALRAAARLRMQRKRAEISAADYKTKARYVKQACKTAEKYRDKKAEEERTADAAKRLLRKKITLKSKTKPQDHPNSRPTTTTKLKTRPNCDAPAAPPPTAAAQVKLLERRAHRHVDNNEDALSDDSSCEDRRRRRRSESPVFPGHTQPRTVVPPPCLECGEGGCPGCACMCMESVVWIDHEGGHFFPTCKKCGGDECPGCACTCPQGTAWIEHGGHRVT
ncbi:hypothetical protein B0H13DRAFT_1880209 [Mycena leptocephala]|nr:hypothetical protein B0H13DRAFT_1880209 [Mycena leptocephala]